MELTRLFLEVSLKTLVQTQWPRMRESVESLTDEQVWWRPNDASNSIGNLLLHLNGNIRQWLVSSFAAQPDHRDRSAEFSERHHVPRTELLSRLGATIQDAALVLERLTETDLARTFVVQGYKTSGLEAVYHVVEHFSMHYGQVLYITKLLRGEGLGFYKELDKTGRRE